MTIRLSDDVRVLEVKQAGAGFPTVRPRRLRLHPQLRVMVRETQLAPDDFIYPLFVTHGRGVKNPIQSMPGVFQWSPDLLAREAESIAALGIVRWLYRLGKRALSNAKFSPVDGEAKCLPPLKVFLKATRLPSAATG